MHWSLAQPPLLEESTKGKVSRSSRPKTMSTTWLSSAGLPRSLLVLGVCAEIPEMDTDTAAMMEMIVVCLIFLCRKRRWCFVLWTFWIYESCVITSKSVLVPYIVLPSLDKVALGCQDSTKASLHCFSWWCIDLLPASYVEQAKTRPRTRHYLCIYLCTLPLL